MEIVNRLGVSSKYTGIMNVDMMIHHNKPHLLEINPRFSGSIYISMKTSLLKDYFRLLLNKKFSNIQNIDYQENKITKASEVKDFSIIPFVMENLGIILSIDKLDVDTYAVNQKKNNLNKTIMYKRVLRTCITYNSIYTGNLSQ